MTQRAWAGYLIKLLCGTVAKYPALPAVLCGGLCRRSKSVPRAKHKKQKESIEFLAININGKNDWFCNQTKILKRGVRPLRLYFDTKIHEYSVFLILC
jgi:hypothetical protein